MMKKNIFALTLLALATVGITSCEDMLTGDMDRNVGIEEVATDTLYSYWGIFKSVQQVAERYVILGECRGDLVNGTAYVSDSISAILNFGLSGNTADGSNRFLKAADFYHIINSCNAYLQQADINALSGLNRPIMRNEYAQVATIRAWTYLQLVLIYGEVPYFEKPMLSTADMEEFQQDAQYVNANTLATTNVVKMVDELRHIPSLYAEDPSDVIAYPDYGIYGGYSKSDSKTIAYASQCIFPQDLVLGDIWLLRAQGEGSEADYSKAAQYYYNFLDSEIGGLQKPNTYFGRITKNQTTDQYSLVADEQSWMNIFYDKDKNHLSKPSQTNEVVTVIPSSKNKLNGVVFRAMNELFGFDQTLTVTGDSTGTGNINLAFNFQHQLDASKAYETLNKQQDYEIYVGPTSATAKCTVYSEAGDARYRMTIYNTTDQATGSTDAVSFVQKQNRVMNGTGQFTTTYPIIYRKANIWLRFAEALNGAGFPGYAFAILRHGLVGTYSWLPNDERYYAPATQQYTYRGLTCTGYACKYYIEDEIDNTTNPDEPDTTFYDYAAQMLYHVYQRAIADSYPFTPSIVDTDPEYYITKWYCTELKAASEEEEDAEKNFKKELGGYISTLEIYEKPTSYANYIDPETSIIVCNYISKDEMTRAKSASFLKFEESQYLQGNRLLDTDIEIKYGTSEYNVNEKAYSFLINGGVVTQGIHARGCGFLSIYERDYGEQEDGTYYGTHYNYVEQINRMRERYEGITTPMNIEEICDPANKRKVQEAIASLILEEMGLETAFEGNRFFDLLCYSRMIGGQKGVDRVAKMISERSGTTNSSLYSHLQNSDNWYFKLPNK